MEKLFEYRLSTIYNISGIYSIKIGEHLYVGSSINLGGRLVGHRSELMNSRHKNLFILNCFNKYGSSSCYFSILEKDVPKEQLRIREKHYMDLLKPDLNCEPDPTTQQNCKTTSKVVYQFNLDGTFIKEHSSVSQAFRETGVKSIHLAASKKHEKYKSMGGYLWSYTKEVPSYENNSSKAKTKNVYMYDKDGNRVNAFTSIAQAAKHIMRGDDKFESVCSKISAICGNRHSYEIHGYHFSFRNQTVLKRRKRKRKMHVGP